MKETPLIADENHVRIAYRRAWFPVCRSLDLVGGPRAVMLLGERLVAFRGEDKRAYVMRNQCAHRGAPLHPGRVVGSEIECPYHGWRFKGESGACTLIPSSGPQAPVPPGAHISAYPAVERYGLLWTCLEPMGVPFPESQWLVEWDSWQSGAGRPIEVACGIRNTVENFRDVAHFAFIHRRTMGAMDPRVEPLQISREGYCVTMAREYKAVGGFEEVWHDKMVFTYQVRPAATVALRMEGAEGVRYTVHAAQPVDDQRTIIWFTTAIVPGWKGISVADAVEHEHIIYSEDCPIISQLNPREAPLFGAPGQVHSPADKFTLAYRKAFAEWARYVADLEHSGAHKAQHGIDDNPGRS
jgi:phenylpropionate dioxygenase-like ring-hydroxylating dioxygenase large terminal subunit